VSHPLLDRRAFLQTVSGALAASAFAGRPLYGAADAVAASASEDGTTRIRFLEPAEVLICGSTLFACQLALDSALGGRRTVLVMDRVNPFFEGVSCLRSWLESADEDAFPAVVRGVLAEATAEAKGGRTYFNASKAALEIEERLSEAGVRFLYNAPVAGALGAGGRLCGAVFGGKTGLFAIEASWVVDATPEATLARACGAKFTPVTGPRRFHYVADLAAPVAARSVSYTAANGARVAVQLHHYFAEFNVELDSTENGPLAAALDFEKVYAAALEMPWTGAEKRFRGADGCLGSGCDRLACTNGVVQEFDNLLVFGPMAVADGAEGSLLLKDWKSLFKAFPDATARLLQRPVLVLSEAAAFEFWNRGVPAESAPARAMAHTFVDHGFEEPGVVERLVRFHPPQPALRTELLVVGGGTSGNAAAYAAAGLGIQTVCLERGYELGGTNTLGGVTNLWYGKRTKAFEDYYGAMDAKNDGLNAPGFYRGVRRAGARILFGCAITGVAQEGRNVSRVYVITPFGMVAVEAPRFIDATGDGAVAAWAGCAYSFGGEHDEMTLWASFAGYKPGRPEALRPFLSPCDERSALDTTRFILSMRRNSKVPLEQKHVPPPFYVAPRESRHIRGGKTLTFLDLLAGRRFADGVFRVESNPDIKGLATSDAAKAGFIPTNWKALYQVTIPYSAMVPLTLDNVLIAGKAYSATHDALSAARMQRDLCVMGMVAANAVHLSVVSGKLLRDIPVRELQQILIAKGMLKTTDLPEDDFGFKLTPEEMAKKVASTSDLDESLAASAMLCLIPREKALAALEPFAAAPHAGVERVLCFLGHPRGIERYLAEVGGALEASALSTELFGGRGTKHLMPDQGYAPVSALMLGSLAHAGERRAVSLLARLASKIRVDPEDLQTELRSAWGYLYTLACGYERLACAEGRAPLRQVLGSVFERSHAVPRKGDLRACRNVPGERMAYLQMALSRALLRCGDAEGAVRLCEFLDEARVCLARAARSELVAAAGRDFGFDAEAWRTWIAARGAEIRPNPLTKAFA
jgi:hypothetical protein